MLLSFPSDGEEKIVVHTVRRCTYVREVSLSFVCFGSAVPLFGSGASVAPGVPDGKAQKGAALLFGYTDPCDRLLSVISSLSALSDTSGVWDVREMRARLLAYRLADSEAARSRAEKAVCTSNVTDTLTKTTAAGLLTHYLSLLPPIAETVSAPCDGWFFSECDGEEAVFDTLNAPQTLTLSQIHRLNQAAKQTDSRKADGKLYISPVWYAAALVSPDVAALFCEGESYDLPFPDGTVSGKLVSREGDGKETLLLFSVYGLPLHGIVRRQTCYVVCERFSALRVPAVCLRTSENGQAFVFVLRGQRILARAVSVRYRDGGYTYLHDLTEKRMQDGVTLRPLAENEAAVLSGGDLFHLKILNK